MCLSVIAYMTSRVAMARTVRSGTNRFHAWIRAQIGDYESEREIDTHPLRLSNIFSEIVRCVLNHLYDTYEKQ